MAYNPNQKRHPAGAPKSIGGQYAPDNQRGGAVAVAEPKTTPTTITGDPMTVMWTERNVLPTPRHRKPRDVEREFEVQPEFLSVPFEATGEAFTIEDGYRGDQREYRHYEGELYRPVLAGDIFYYREGEPAPDYAPYPNRTDHVEGTPEQLTSLLSDRRVHRSDDGEDKLVREFRGYDFESEEEAREAVEKRASQYVVIDGKLWEKTPEPSYKVSTFGLGGNHGGTALMTSGGAEPGKQLRNDQIFSLDEFEEAKQYALSVAEERGDTDSLERIRNMKPIAVVDPDRPWAHPKPPIRIPDVPDVYDVPFESRGSLEQHKIRMRKIRQQIEQHAPEAIYTDPETGKRKVDFSRLTIGVEKSYRHYAKKIHELSEPDLDSF